MAYVRVNNVISGFGILSFSNEQCIHITSGLRVFWTRISEKLSICWVKCDAVMSVYVIPN